VNGTTEGCGLHKAGPSAGDGWDGWDGWLGMAQVRNTAYVQQNLILRIGSSPTRLRTTGSYLQFPRDPDGPTTPQCVVTPIPS
jgi:hypothetical protein